MYDMHVVCNKSYLQIYGSIKILLLGTRRTYRKKNQFLIHFNKIQGQLII